MQVSGDDLRRLASVAHRRHKSKYKQHSGYLRGLTEVPWDGLTIGLLGEYAVAKYLEVEFSGDEDYEVRDDGDLLVSGEKWEVKTHSRKNQDASLVRAVDESGRVIPLDFSYMVAACADLDSGEVLLLGYCTAAVVAQQPIVNARRGTHKNREVPLTLLEPMSAARRLVNAKRKLAR